MIENHLLHAAAWGLLHVTSPRRALSWTSRIARVLSPLANDEDGRRVAIAIGQSGTCLSRALTVASRLRGAEVVIGVAMQAESVPGRTVAAHAWVERAGAPLFLDDPNAGEITRMRPHSSPLKEKTPLVHLKSKGP